MKAYKLTGALLGLGLCLVGADARAQIYGFTNDKGVLILSNVPSDRRMNLIARGSPEEAGKIWRYNGQYESLIMKAAQAAGVDPTLVKAVIAIESAFNRFARSHKGAQGLMQLMPATARRYGVINPYDPWQNVNAGARHLRDLLDEFRDLRLSLAAYNAGATPVRRLKRVPPYKETQDYVRKVMAVYQAGSRVRASKGDRLYSIAPNRRSKVAQLMRSAPKQTTSASAPARTATGDAPPPPAEGAHSEPLSASSADEGSIQTALLYYRYRDDDGVVYITRNKPPDVEYEVLEP